MWCTCDHYTLNTKGYKVSFPPPSYLCRSHSPVQLMLYRLAIDGSLNPSACRNFYSLLTRNAIRPRNRILANWKFGGISIQKAKSAHRPYSIRDKKKEALSTSIPFRHSPTKHSPIERDPYRKLKLTYTSTSSTDWKVGPDGFSAIWIWPNTGAGSLDLRRGTCYFVWLGIRVVFIAIFSPTALIIHFVHVHIIRMRLVPLCLQNLLPNWLGVLSLPLSLPDGDSKSTHIGRAANGWYGRIFDVVIFVKGG